MNIFSKRKRFLPMALLLITGTKALAENTTFEKVCSSCHTGGFKGFVTGAPNVNDYASWDAYVDRHTPEQMSRIVLNGEEDHKVKGGCRKCSDKDIVDAITYILSNYEAKGDE